MKSHATALTWLRALSLAAMALALGPTSLGCEHAFRFEPTRDANADAPLARPPPCVDDTGCGLASLHCEVASGACVECTNDAHCAAGPSTLTRCNLATNRCVECSIDADCGLGHACALAVRRCVDRCDTLTDCPLDAHECELSSHVCERCDVRADCDATPATPVCDDASHGCVTCVRDLDCPPSAPQCDRPRARCVSCLGSEDCPASAPWCDPSSATCVSS